MPKLPAHVTRAICYVRKSREDEEAEQRGEDTLLKQRDLMQRDVLAQYAFAYDIAQEVASGDNIRDRPVFRSILPELGHRYQAIVCKDLSRLGRGSYSDMGIVYDIIRDRRIYIITKDTVYDPLNFSDLRMIRFSLFFNREEYEMTVWRLTEGKYDGARRGKWVAGSVPFGYAYDPKLQILEPVAYESDIVQMIFRWYATDLLGYQAIATRLGKLGIPSPRGRASWHAEVIRRMLQNVVYQGTLSFRRSQRNKLDGRVVQRPPDEHIVVPNAFAAIVDDATWQLAQQRRQAHRPAPSVKLDFTPSELAGLVTCHACGKKVVRQRATQSYQTRSGKVSTYEKVYLYCARCRFSVRYRDCETTLLRVLETLPAVDLAILSETCRQLQAERPPVSAADVAETPSSRIAQGRNPAPMDDVLAHLTSRQATVQQRLARARDFLLDGTFEAADFAATKLKCEAELAQIAEALRYAYRQRGSDDPLDQPVPAANVLDTRLGTRHTWRDIYEILAGTSAKNRLLHGIFDEVRLEVVRKGRSKARPTQFNLHVRLAKGWA